MGIYARSAKRSSMVQQSASSSPLPQVPNKSPSSRSISTIGSVKLSNESTLVLEAILPVIEKVCIFVLFIWKTNFFLVAKKL